MTEIEVYAQSALYSIPVVAYWSILTAFVLGVSVIQFSQSARKVRKMSLLMLVEWIVLVFCSTVVFRNTRVESEINVIPLSSYFCITENSYLLEVTVINLLNVAMFVPIGMLLRFSNLNLNDNKRVNWKGAMVVGLLISMAIEVSQFMFRKGLCEVDDVIHNVVGCMVGYAIATLTITLTLMRVKVRNKKIIK